MTFERRIRIICDDTVVVWSSKGRFTRGQ